MLISEVAFDGGRFRGQGTFKSGCGKRIALLTAFLVLTFAANGLRADTTNSVNSPDSDPSDPILNLFLQKGFITQSEADKARAEVAAMRTNESYQLPAAPSRWKLSDDVKSLELFGDFKLRYEDRASTAPDGLKIDLQRFRYAMYLGVRGDAFDNFYYGFRLETAENPRSPWVTLGQSATVTSTSPYQGPFGKSDGGLNVGQIYLGWRPTDWADFTVGKMPNPFYTTPMVWDSDLEPEGIVERFKDTVGEADFFATMGQFVYAAQDPDFESAGLAGPGYPAYANQNALFMIAWSGGVIYHITTNITAKVGANVYQYYGQQKSSISGIGVSPYFGDTFVGEGAYVGPGAASTYPYGVNGLSGYGTGVGGSIAGQQSLNYANNQVGINDLLVLEVPFEVDFKLWNNKLDARVFGDVAYNFQGRQRAEAAASAYGSYLNYEATTLGLTSGVLSPFAPQTSDNKAYQFGMAIGSDKALGIVYGADAPRHAWEARAYWQHIEQYSLDPNLVDSDFFEGAENLQGLYLALAYGFTDNFVGTFRYGYASRINNKLGTASSDQDIPQINPIDKYQLFQFDLSYKF